jgi:hypothetical protein
VNPFDKVKDSSVWYRPNAMAAAKKIDSAIRIGVVSKISKDKDSDEARYFVEVKDKNDTIYVWCKPMYRFTGVYNYEEYTGIGYTPSPTPSFANTFNSKAGDFVLVAFLAGDPREGIILGGLNHPARKPKTNPDNGPEYFSEFNGIEKTINKDGEYTIVFKGVPINVAALKTPSTGAPIIPPTYNPTITGTFMKFDKQGSWELSDEAIGLKQSIKLDKPGGKITLTSGQSKLEFNKTDIKTTLATNTLEIDTKLKINQKTLDFSLEAKKDIKIKGLKIAIGTSGMELFEELIEFITNIGQVQVQSPTGPCTPLMASPQWAKIEAIKTKFSIAKGSL